PLIYQKDMLTAEETAEYQKNFDDIIQTIEAEDWTAYANLRLEQMEAGSEEAPVKEARGYWYRYMLDQQIEPDTGDWREDAAREAGSALLEVAQLEQQKAEGRYVSDTSYEEAQNQAAICEYRLEHGIESYIDEDGSTESA